MFSRNKLSPLVVVVVVTSLTAGACGGGGHTYKAGTPAATGQAPDCSVAPLDLVAKTLKRDLTGPVAETRASGITCTYPAAKAAGGGVADQIQLNSQVDNLNLFREGLKRANNPVKKIGGWGDEAYAATVFGYATINNFAVRKGKVSVIIISTADYDALKKLMKAVLAKL